MALVWTATGNPAIVDKAFGSQTHTFSAVSIGTASSDRIVVVGFTYSANSPVDTITVGGISATKRVESNASARSSSIWTAAVPTGTTADIVVTDTEFLGIIGITVGILTGANETPTATGVLAYAFGADNQNVTLTIPTDGIAIACGHSETTNTTTWITGTNDFDTKFSTTHTNLLGHHSTSGSQTLSVSGYNFAGFGWAAAAFEPAAAGGATHPGWMQAGGWF